MKKYYCQDCGKEVNEKRAKRCRHCAHLRIHFSSKEIGKRSKALKGRKFSKETLEKMSQSSMGRIPWNKGKIGFKGYWTGKSNKNIIVKHHIDSNNKNNDKSNFLKIKQGEHRSLHWRGYEYLVSLGLIKDYLSEFITKNGIKSDKRNCKVIHHIDCNRSHNDESNWLYLKDKKIHNKLHQHAYLYLVRINKIHDYIDCFFLWKKGNTQKVKAKEELK
jgi:DNA-directed RNA polymerase subunit RPC12/RpoP